MKYEKFDFYKHHSLPLQVNNPWFDERGHLDNHISEYAGVPEDELPFYMKPTTSDPESIASSFCEHVHREIEVTFTVSGEWRVRINGAEHDIFPGDIYVVNPFEKHTGYTLNRGFPKTSFTVIFNVSYFAKVLPAEMQKMIVDLERGAFRFGNVWRGRWELLPLFEELHDAFTGDDAFGMASGAYRLLGALFRDDVAVRDGEPDADREFVMRVSDIIGERYAEALSAASVSTELGYAETYFCRKFRNGFGTTFTDRLNSERISRARAMTIEEYGSIAGIAAACGFADYKYFARVFRKYTGMSPTQYYG